VKKNKTPSFRRREGAGGELTLQADGYELTLSLTPHTSFGGILPAKSKGDIIHLLIIQ
jgi:hypothetical protein